MRRLLRCAIFSFVLGAITAPVLALDHPWIADTFFYWYTWDYDKQTGDWMGQGVHNTPLEGYYDSQTFRDNRRSLHTASEWGLTHHFMDYWAPDWKGEGGQMREAIVMRASFDVGYHPYMDFGFADYARVFGGPHSYGGIFGPPDQEDVERYIHASMARKYNTVFFDHFKNYYFDWDIRVPGTAFLPDPYCFDRFWVGALARRSEALLHLSWNEWWEGSNLEPSREFGKTYCEKNLFYATLMKLAFDSIHNAERAAKIGVLVNDWRLASGSPFQEELYGTIQTLRRLCVPFDLVPDGLATAEGLDRFQLLIAPAYSAGLGENARGEAIGDVLAKWLRAGPRRLVVSHHPSLAATFGLRETSPPAAIAGARGQDMNVFIDVGAEGDDKFLRSGYSQRESSGAPPNPADPRSSFRWTPGVGNETSLLLPASTNRDHVLRVLGDLRLFPLPFHGRLASGEKLDATSELRYYGVYQFAFSPVKVIVLEEVYDVGNHIQPGETKAFVASVTNLTSKPLRGTIQAASIIPTVSGPPTPVELGPNETKNVNLRVTAAPTADWGTKTIYVNLDFNGRRAVIFRRLVIQRPTEVVLATSVLDPASPVLAISARENEYGATAPLNSGRVTFRGQSIPFRVEGKTAETAFVSLPRIDLPPASTPELQAEKVRIELAPPRAGEQIEREVFLARRPAHFAWPGGAVSAAVVFNARSTPLQNEAVTVHSPTEGGPFVVRTDGGGEVACQKDASNKLPFLADVPARAGRTFYVCRGEPKATSDLRCAADGLGTGKGTLKVENAKMRVVLSEAAGGTVTTFRVSAACSIGEITFTSRGKISWPSSS